MRTAKRRASRGLPDRAVRRAVDVCRHQFTQRSDVQNQRHLATAQDAGAGNASQGLEQAPQRFDHRLLLAQQDFHLNAVFAARRVDHTTLVRSGKLDST